MPLLVDLVNFVKNKYLLLQYCFLKIGSGEWHTLSSFAPDRVAMGLKHDKRSSVEEFLTLERNYFVFKLF